MKKLIVLFFVGMMSAAVWAGETVTITVKGMVCSFCAQGLDKKFKAESAVEKVDVSLKEKRILLQLKDGQELSDEKIKALVNDAGYNVHAISRGAK